MDPHDAALLATQLAMGFALAACVGLRTFLPLLAAGVLARMGYLELGAKFQWMASTPALVVFGSAMAFEILADKIPGLDHALHAAESLVKPVAATVLAASLLPQLDPTTAMVVGLVSGGTAAGVVQVARGTTRLASTMFTGGLANPLLSLADDAMAAAGVALAFAVPVLAALGVIALVVTAAWFLTRRRAKSA
ncbi:MAG TPA: DUF4126 domain-containing protein [Usitatibacter sp.]|nr:DUF4126 domain-containing protein [Usitatibacter sp.]